MATAQQTVDRVIRPASSSPNVELLQPAGGIPPYSPTHRAFYDTSASRALFDALSGWWHSETGSLSSPADITSHPAYRKIIEQGPSMVPYILDDLEKDGGDWYEALLEITKADPDPIKSAHYGDENKMRQDWLAWAKEHGYRA